MLDEFIVLVQDLLTTCAQQHHRTVDRGEEAIVKVADLVCCASKCKGKIPTGWPDMMSS